MPQVRDAHSAQQQKTIREENAKLVEQQMKEFVPEGLVKNHLCDIRIDKYETTDLRGMLEVTMHVFKGGKKIQTKCVIKGVFYHEMMDALDKAIHWRIYNMK